MGPLEGTRWHKGSSLRFFERGLSVPEVALISGHRDARMLFRYAHAVREAIIRKLEPNRIEG